MNIHQHQLNNIRYISIYLGTKVVGLLCSHQCFLYTFGNHTCHQICWFLWRGDNTRIFSSKFFRVDFESPIATHITPFRANEHLGVLLLWQGDRRRIHPSVSTNHVLSSSTTRMNRPKLSKRRKERAVNRSQGRRTG